MHHRAPPAIRLGLDQTRAGGPVRIIGVYPPPLVAAPTPAIRPDGDIADADRPRVTRYDRSRHRAPRASRPHAARAWTGASAVLAVAGLAAVVLLPQGQPRPARLDVPVAVVAAPATAPPNAPASQTAPASRTASQTAPAPRTASQTAPASRPAETLQLPASDPVRVQVPALGVTSRIMDLGLERDGSMEVPPGAYPVGWYDRSPTPGQLGPAVLAGHVDWEGEPGVFYGLRELVAGDEVVVERADGTVATFQVDRVEEHPKDDFPTEEVYGDLDHAGLRLITCGGGFDEDTGDYLENVIVFARLVATG